jgi:hypothetical protein
MTKIEIIKRIDKLAFMGLSWKRKIQLLFWDKKRLERIVKVLNENGNRWIV